MRTQCRCGTQLTAACTCRVKQWQGHSVDLVRAVRPSGVKPETKIRKLKAKLRVAIITLEMIARRTGSVPDLVVDWENCMKVSSREAAEAMRIVKEMGK